MSAFASPASLRRAAQLLLFLNAAVWLLLAFAGLYRIPAGAANSPTLAWVITILMFGNAAAMLVAGVVIVLQRRLFTLFAILVLLVNILLTITDQFGLLDFITLVIDLIVLALIMAVLVVEKKGK